MNNSNNTSNLINEEKAVVNMSEHNNEPTALIEAIQNGATLKDLHGISNETMQGIYKLAYDFYQQGKLEDAESLFRFLCVYDFYNAEYIMGLAAVYQLKKNYAKAIDFYALAYSLSREDYRPMFYAGQCNLMLGRAIPAKKCFEIVSTRSTNKSLNEKAQAYLLAMTEMDPEDTDKSEKEQSEE